FVEIGTLGSHLLWFPADIAKVYLVQHAVNEMAAVLLGSGSAVIIAGLIALIRNMLGLGSLLAFPRFMVCVFEAGYFYKNFKKVGWAALGEAICTGLIGSLFSVPFAKVLMGSSVGALFFMPSFLTSSMTGALIGWILAARLQKTNTFQHMTTRSSS